MVRQECLVRRKERAKADLDNLERALTRLADVVATEFGLDFRNEAGAGAAGGLGFGLLNFCGATIRPGFEVVAEAVGLESKMKDADLVITGEGSLDRQTLEGKTPVGVARLARKLGKPVFAIVGRASDDREVREIFDGYLPKRAPGNEPARKHETRSRTFARERARVGRHIWRRAVTCALGLLTRVAPPQCVISWRSSDRPRDSHN